MFTRIALAFLLACAVAACGGEESTEEPGGPSPAAPPPAPRETVEPVLRPPLEIALDEESMGALLELHKQVVAAGADVSGAMAIGSGSERDFHWYTQALKTWRAVEEATTQGGDPARSELARLDERIAELEAALAAAADADRVQAQRTLDLTKRMRPSLAKHVESLAGLDSPGNRKLVERWKPRFDAVDAQAKK